MCDQLSNDREFRESLDRHVRGVSSPMNLRPDGDSSSSDEDDEVPKSMTQLTFPEHPPVIYEEMSLHKPDWCHRPARGIIPGIIKRKKAGLGKSCPNDIMLPACCREQMTLTSTVAFQKLYGRKKHVAQPRRDSIDILLNPDKQYEEDDEEEYESVAAVDDRPTPLFIKKNQNLITATGDSRQMLKTVDDTILKLQSLELDPVEAIRMPRETAESPVLPTEALLDDEADRSQQKLELSNSATSAKVDTKLASDDIRRFKSDIFLSKKKPTQGPKDGLFVNGFDGSPIQDRPQGGLRCGYTWAKTTIDQYIG